MNFIPGTQVVLLSDFRDFDGVILRGTVGTVLEQLEVRDTLYRIRFSDGREMKLEPRLLALLASFKHGKLSESSESSHTQLFERIFYRCVIGSQAYGLADAHSDIDRRGIYLPPAELHWSLGGVPEQLANHERQEAYWEVEKFVVLALKANPNVLECLFTPIIETMTPLAEELLGLKMIFLSKLVYQTYSGYVMSQFKKIQGDLRNQGQVKWKHVMHLIRLLHAGIVVLREGYVPVRIDTERERLLAIKRGEMAWEVIEKWRLELHQEMDAAYRNTNLPERPDYKRANDFLISARRRALATELP